MNIEFFWNSNIVGTNYHMTVNNTEIPIGCLCTKEEAISNAIQILKESYNFEFDTTKIKEIKFKWGGTL